MYATYFFVIKAYIVVLYDDVKKLDFMLIAFVRISRQLSVTMESTRE